MSEADQPPPAGEPGRDPSPEELAALLSQLQVTAEQLGGQLGDLGRLGADAARLRAEQLPAASRLLELAPPDLRRRLADAATAGLSATRDLADWALTQLHPDAPMPEPEELPIARLVAAPPARPTSVPAPSVTASALQDGPLLPHVPATWILTASVDNHEASEARNFSVIGIKEANRRRALEIEPGDVIVLYLTKAMAFAGAIRITGDLYEDRTKIWPGQPGKPDSYPWRFPTEPIIALPREAWVPAGSLKTQLEHVQKWPIEHWTLSLQGQLRTVSEHDGALLMEQLQAAAATTS